MFRNLYSYPIFIGTFKVVQIFFFLVLKTDRIFKKQCAQTGPVNFGKDPDKREQICTSIKICNVRLTIHPQREHLSILILFNKFVLTQLYIDGSRMLLLFANMQQNLADSCQSKNSQQPFYYKTIKQSSNVQRCSIFL